MDQFEQWLAQSPRGGMALDRLEDDVWARVRARKAARATKRLRVVAVAFALSVGAANGGLGASVARSPAPAMSVFTDASLSPLARLEVG